MTISYKKLNEGGYTRQRGKKWKCPNCGKENINQSIDPRSGEIQKCEVCGTPKPMIFGVRVCEACMRSDQVYVLPSYIHKCPVCGSNELRRFPPITDEALKQGIHPKYDSLKWKCKCGKDNPYPYANCINCGLSIDDGLNETSTDTDEPTIEIAKRMRRSNWKCSYCGRINRGIDEKCRGCGNSEKNPEDEIIRTIRPELFSDEIAKPSQDSSCSNDQYAKQESIYEIPGRKKFEFHPGILEKGESFLAGASSIAKRTWWVFPILFIVLLIMGNIKEEEFIISDIKYNSTYIIEKYTTIHHTGSTYPPVGAYNVFEKQESRYVPDQDDDNDWDDDDWGSDWGTDWDDDDWGSDWGTDWDDDDWGSDWGTNWDDDDWGSDWGTDDDWGSNEWNDYGGDYYDSIIHIVKRLRNSIIKRIEYYTVYEYDFDEWVYSRTINYSGGKEEIKSPELPTNERISSTTTNYTIYLKTEGSANLYSLKISEEEWQKYLVGDTIRVKTLFGYPQFIVKEY